MSAQYKSILKYVGLFGSIQGLNLLIGIIRSKLAAELLAPAGVGLSSMLNTAVNFLSSSTNLGISVSAVQSISESLSENSENSEDSKSSSCTLQSTIAIVRTWSLIAAALGFCVTIIAAPFIDSLTFSWGNHTLHYLMLAPTVALLAITGGEAAILKGTRRMKNLATVQLVTVAMSVAITAPLYYFWGQKGIVPVIFLTTLTSMIATILYSCRHYPYRISGIRRYIKEGTPMVKLGLSFVAAGIMGSAVEMYIRAFLNMHGDLDMVGLYYAAVTMAITYPSALLNSLENDYFARLSAVNHDNKTVRAVANAQIEVLLMVMFPVIAILMAALPIAVPLLFSSKFVGSIPMAQAALIAMLLRTASLPIEYISLAKGNSRIYLLIETISNICIMASLTVGYLFGGLLGMGFGWVAVYGMTIIFVLLFFYFKWNFTLSRKATLLLLSELAALVALYTCLQL